MLYRQNGEVYGEIMRHKLYEHMYLV